MKEQGIKAIKKESKVEVRRDNERTTNETGKGTKPIERNDEIGEMMGGRVV